jgi:diacylglycerol O-acyltransferase / wax synthase
MQKLGFADASFLHLERTGAPMNIATVQRFAAPSPNFDVTDYFECLKGYLAARVHGVPFMTRRLKSTPFELDQPAWVTDSEFDISKHLFRTRLPPPGTEKQLNTLISRLHEKPLDRSRPLWQMYLIDGLSAGGFLLYNKYHHAAVDGVSGQQILNVLYSRNADSVPEPAVVPRTETAGGAELVVNALINLTLQPFEQLTRVGERIRAANRLNDLLRGTSASGSMASAPPTPFNVRVSEYRSFATASLPLNQMRLLGKRLGVSMNDVLLAVCADGLRRYLARKDALPSTPLLAGIPVSLRSPGDHSYNNKVTMMRASLATDLEDPLARLAAISESTRAGKAVLTELKALIPDDVHVPGLSWMLQGAVSMADRLRLGNLITPACNVIISNVPGPRKPRYLLGAEMLTHHPVSIAADGNALNITVQSYRGRLDLGITACLEAVPDIEELRDDLVHGWRALLETFEPKKLKVAA